MIDPEVFRVSRQSARSKLSPQEAAGSFGYWIDVPNGWESYLCPQELIAWLSIHRTHKDNFNNVAGGLGQLTAREFNWAYDYLWHVEGVARMLATTGYREDLRYDLAETIADWRHVEMFKSHPMRVLDFGAGCGRHGLSAHLRHKGNIYTAVDATLAAYTVQNLLLSFIDSTQPQAQFYDLLDFEKAGQPMPDIASAAAPGAKFHVPCWMAERQLPSAFYDVILACHVHGELSPYDFMRLVRIVEKCLEAQGVFYVRSQLAWGPDLKDYMDAVDLHGIDLVVEMRRRKILPVWSAFSCGYLSTVFAREGSVHHIQAQASNHRNHKFLDCTDGHQVSQRAHENEHRHPPTLAIDPLFNTPIKSQADVLKAAAVDRK